MRTTLNIDDQLLKMAKHQAVEKGISLSDVIETALRQFVQEPRLKSHVIRLVTAAGSGTKPGVDLNNSQSLLDIMDEPE